MWLTNFTELELEQVIPEVLASEEMKNFTHFSVVSDDCVVSQDAFDAVSVFAELGDDAVYTGYVNCDVTSDFASITRRPFEGNGSPNVESYDWMLLNDVRAHRSQLIRTHFAGFTFTTMSRSLWERFPWECFGRSETTGWASDYSLALRLRDAGVPIWAVKDGFIYHTKLNWTQVGLEGRRALNIGKFPSQVRYDFP